MENKNKTLGIVGSTPEVFFGFNFPYSYVRLKNLLLKKFEHYYKDGYRHFYTCGNQGFEMVAFFAIEDLKDAHDDVTNNLLVIDKNMDANWESHGYFSKGDYAWIKEHSDSFSSSDNIANELLFKCDALFFSLQGWTKMETLNTQIIKSFCENGKPAEQFSYILNNEKDWFEKYGFSSANNAYNLTLPGELFGISEGILCQQVNCQGVMGAGLAKAIADKYPQVKNTFDNNYKKNKGGQFGKYQIVQIAKNLYVANIYSQDGYGNGPKNGITYTDKDALVRCIADICSKHPELVVYLPHVKGKTKVDGIGCGLAGEKWENIEPDLINLDLPNLKLINTKACEIHDFEYKNYKKTTEGDQIDVER